MNKTEYVAAVAKASGMTKAQAALAVDACIAVVTKALKKGEAVQLTGFGTFETVKRAAHTGRNPATGSDYIPKTKSNKSCILSYTIKKLSFCNGFILNEIQVKCQ